MKKRKRKKKGMNDAIILTRAGVYLNMVSNLTKVTSSK